MNQSQPMNAAPPEGDYDANSMSVRKAREYIAKFLTPITDSLQVPINDALNRVLSEDIISPVNVPPHTNSGMDGWAVKAADLAITGESSLIIAGEAFAGRPYRKPINVGECIRIMTGAIIPDGADTVVMQERARVEGSRVIIEPNQKKGQHLRHAGEDLQHGGIALAKGRLIRPSELGLLASLGIDKVNIYRPLRVAYLSTGDELCSLGSPLREGQIYDTNSYTLYGMLKHLGCETINMGIVADDPVALETAFRDASQIADVIISSGGVSVGEADYVKAILNKLGEVVFWKIAMKPGRPLAYGKIGNAHFFGLPGNPVSTVVTFYQFVREALLALMGMEPVPSLPLLKAKCLSPIKKAPGRMEFQRGVLIQDSSGNWVVKTTGEQGSGILKSMSDANCFIVLDEDTSNLEAGTLVNVQVLTGLM